MSHRVAIQLVVRNGAPWLAAVLDSIAAQQYPDCDVVVWDNASTDETAAIVSRYPTFRLISHPENIGVWAAQERMLLDCRAEYVLVLTDVVLDHAYVSACVETFASDARIGAVQGKLLQKSEPTRVDSLGFRIERSRRVTILGHGDPDDGRWSARMTVLGVEGAAPMFRRAALEECRIEGAVVDPDYRVGPLGYGDDFDLAWRMTLFGWHQVMEPSARGWHDRFTTRNVGHGAGDHVRRRVIRSRIPVSARQLDWSNVRFSIIKNDHILDSLRDIPAILMREVSVLGYFALFEPRTLLGMARFLRLLPTMLRRRRLVMRGARRTPAEMHPFLT